MIPWQCKSALRWLLNAPRRRRATATFLRITKSGAEYPVLNFGGVLDNREMVNGGAVKLLSLRENFDSSDDDFNILYMVSSAQPRFARDLVRACRSRGILFVWNQNGVGYPAWAESEAERHNAPMRSLRRLADFVVYQSDFCRESAEEFLGPCTSRSMVLLNPVDLDEFSPRAEPLPSQPLRLLAMGTQNYRARVFSVLECLRELRSGGLDCTLTIAGPMIWKNAEREVSEFVSGQNLASVVEVHPAFRHEDAPCIYRNHHILIHPKYMDPCPTVVAEALACGLPVVASRSGGVPEMVAPECSSLIEVPHSWKHLHTPTGPQLAEGVRWVSANLPAFSQAARLRAENFFDMRAWCDRHDRIFRELMKVP